MNAIVEDGVPDDLGQAGVGLIADESTEVAYQLRWSLRNGRLVIEIGNRISGEVVARMRDDSTLAGDDRRHA